jgi:hypothetical protein
MTGRIEPAGEAGGVDVDAIDDDASDDPAAR